MIETNGRLIVKIIALLTVLSCGLSVYFILLHIVKEDNELAVGNVLTFSVRKIYCFNNSFISLKNNKINNAILNIALKNPFPSNGFVEVRNI
ncbi:MAG TPA: hypothetical protein PKN75_12610 [Bacteroidia bacterium]|nr:hypothetical protein [Bacteroidia bacterium]HNU34420.1 hypothetical protein [Bacteroidia bacterium]